MRQNSDDGCRRTLSDPSKRGKPTSPLSSTGVPRAGVIDALFVGSSKF